MLKKYSRRVITSMGGRCPYQCKHCYAADIVIPEYKIDIKQAIESISDRCFDIIYVSEKTDVFFDVDIGIKYLHHLYDRYHKDILVITRSHLSEVVTTQLVKLNDNMTLNGNTLYIAESICATKSYVVTENKLRCPTPWERMKTIELLHSQGIKTLVFLRPVFPNSIIPITECQEVIENISTSSDAIVASGLIVTPGILNRLNMKLTDLPLLEKGDSAYLDDISQSEIHYVNVEEELLQLEKRCDECGVPFFRHSIWALNYIKARRDEISCRAI